MKRDTVILILVGATLVELTLIAIIAYRVYQKAAPTINGLTSDYQGIGGLFRLLSGHTTAATPASP